MKPALRTPDAPAAPAGHPPQPEPVTTAFDPTLGEPAAWHDEHDGPDWLTTRLHTEARQSGPGDPAFTEAVLHRLPARREQAAATRPSPFRPAAVVVSGGLGALGLLVGGLLLSGGLSLDPMPEAEALTTLLALGAWLTLLLWWSLALLDAARPWRWLTRTAA